MVSEFDEPHTCPRCGGGIPDDVNPGAYQGAISRWDDKTEICSRCGVREAIAVAVIVAGGRSATVSIEDILDPVSGSTPWVHPPLRT